MLSIDQLKPGESAVIRLIEQRNSAACYLMELGLMAGTTVKMIKRAPLGDPMEIRLRGFNLSIRRSEANAILVEKT